MIPSDDLSRVLSSSEEGSLTRSSGSGSDKRETEEYHLDDESKGSKSSDKMTESSKGSNSSSLNEVTSEPSSYLVLSEDNRKSDESIQMETF